MRMTVLRQRVQVDGERHAVELPAAATIVHVGRSMLHESPGRNAVDFWFTTPTPVGELVTRHFTVVPTGMVWPEGRWGYQGSSVDPETHLVWHLLELMGR